MTVDLSSVQIAATKPLGKVARGLAAMGIHVMPIKEDEGDVDRYVLSKRLVVERRTGGGFLKGIMEKTLFTSAIYMREHFRIPVLIVEGQVNYAYSQFDPQAVRGAMSSMMILYGVNVLASPNSDETVQLLAMMARQEQIGIPEISLIPKRKASSLADMQRRIVEMLPGAGMVMARELLQHFGSFDRIVSATEDEFREVRGIGAKKARQFRDVLTAEYEAVDTERQIEDAIEADHGLLFCRPVKLVARQLHIYTEEKQRHILDMVFFDNAANELILVELKRGRLEIAHYRQIRRYLERAHESPLLGAYLEGGAKLRGILATVEPFDFKPKHADVSILIVEAAQVIDFLKKRRRQLLRPANQTKRARKPRGATS